MAEHVPEPVHRIRVLMFVLAAASLAMPGWFAVHATPDWFFYLIAVVLALPALPPLLCALVARRPSEDVFTGVLVTALALIGWAFFSISGPLQSFAVGPAALIQVLVSAAVLILALQPDSRGFYLRS